MYDLILKNCAVINENKSFESDIAIKNNRIELISNSIDQESKEIIDIFLTTKFEGGRHERRVNKINK